MRHGCHKKTYLALTGHINFASENSFERKNCVREMCGKVEIVKVLVSEVASFVRYMKKSLLNTLLKPPLVSMCDTKWNTVSI